MLLSPDLNPEIIELAMRAGILFVPIALSLLLFIVRPPAYFERVGLLLSFLLCLPAVFFINSLAPYWGWWTYTPTERDFLSIPVELALGWSVFWGVFVPYLFKGQILSALIFASALDLLFMPLFEPLFILGNTWLVGEALLLVFALVPGVLIFRLTAERRWVLGRALLQSYVWGIWILFFIPSMVLQVEGLFIWNLPELSAVTTGLGLIFVGMGMVLGYLALIEFALVGKGTPIPFDPPQRLVTTGIYAYLANPLQCSTLLMLMGVMVFYKSFMMLYPIVILFLFCEGFVRWHHTIDIEIRFGNEWFLYRSQVKNWFPKFSAGKQARC